ncbi:MAG: hypothetical protein ABRQ37_10920 [Candidatus Eremiobacterota bacterium]
MVKIVDFLKGTVVVDELERDFVEKELLQHIAVDYEDDIPETFWLSSDAMEEIQSEEIKDEKLKSVITKLSEYVVNNSEFIDADDDNNEDVNEKGCYLAFQFIKRDPEFKLSGYISKDDAPVIGLMVKLYDKDSREDFLGFAFTDKEGYYEIAFNFEDFVNYLDSKAIPELFLDVLELDRKTGDFNSLKDFELPAPDRQREISFDANI